MEERRTRGFARGLSGLAMHPLEPYENRDHHLARDSNASEIAL